MLALLGQNEYGN